mmetsp:Transcript_79704/g.157896  ORF Transcript_79704/g.157896 Transcript_79704/m.157896 type:complete len:219 (+) Transcript_79704:137-793(+)
MVSDQTCQLGGSSTSIAFGTFGDPLNKTGLCLFFCRSLLLGLYFLASALPFLPTSCGTASETSVGPKGTPCFGCVSGTEAFGEDSTVAGISTNSAATACIPPFISVGSASCGLPVWQESSGAVPATFLTSSAKSFRCSSRAAAITPAKPRCCSSSLLTVTSTIEGTLLSGQDWTFLSNKRHEGTPSLLLSWINVFFTTYGAGSMPCGSQLGSAFPSLP